MEWSSVGEVVKYLCREEYLCKKTSKNMVIFAVSVCNELMRQQQFLSE